MQQFVCDPLQTSGRRDRAGRRMATVPWPSESPRPVQAVACLAARFDTRSDRGRRPRMNEELGTVGGATTSPRATVGQ